MVLYPHATSLAAKITIDANTYDITHNSGIHRVVSMEDPGAGTDKWVYVFYVNSSQQVGYKKSTDNGATFGSFQNIDADLSTYTTVSVWYDRWTARS
jgi:hypothetical protein